jgi:hypothetical protein
MPQTPYYRSARGVKADLTKKGAATVSGGTFRQADGVAEGGQPLGVIPREAVRVEAIKVVTAELAIRHAVAERMIGDDEQAVGDRYDGLTTEEGLRAGRGERQIASYSFSVAQGNAL